MTTRLHHQDLRALMAASIAARDRNFGAGEAIRAAGELLEKLKLAAFTDPKLGEVWEPSGDDHVIPEPDASIMRHYMRQRDNAIEERDRVLATVELLREERKVLLDKLGNRREIAANAAKAERERIIGLFTDRSSPFGVYHWVQIIEANGLALSEDRLRQALEPKP